MRNLKKVLSLALALVMLLGMMVVGAGAATSFSDADSIKNTEAVDVVSGIGILTGVGDGSFNPTGTLSRAEAAVVIAKLDLGAAFGNLETTNASTFSDVPTNHWGKAYIDYCAARGLIQGDGAGKFLPDKKVSGVEFALMVSRVLGYEDANENIGGASWEVDAAALARKAGLTVNVTLGSLPMTRDDMAQVAYNALTADVVEYDGRAITIGNVTIPAGKATPKQHYINSNYDHYIISANNTTDPNVQLCEEKFPALKLNKGQVDDFARPVNLWVERQPNGTVKTLNTNVQNVALTYIDSVSKAKIYSDLGLTATAADVEYYVDGRPTNYKNTDGAGCIDISRSSTQYVGGPGVLTQVFTNDVGYPEKVVEINTYVGRVNAVSSSNETTTITQLGQNDGSNIKLPILDSRTIKMTGFSVGDLVSYTAAWNGTNYSVQEMDVLTNPVTGTLTKWTGTNVIDADKGTSNSNFTLDGGDPYKYSMKSVIHDNDGQNAQIYSFTANKSELNVYLDEHGFALYVAGVEGEKNYAAVIGIGATNAYGSESKGVTLLLADGTTVEVTAKLAGSATWEGTFKGINAAGTTVDGWKEDGSYKNLVTDGIADVVTYTVDDKGVYTLTLVTDRSSNKTGNYVTADATASKVVKFTNGKSLFEIGTADYYTTSKTIFMVATDRTGGKSYSVYTGYANAPSVLTDGDVKGVAYGLNRTYQNQIDVVYIDATRMANTAASNIYFVKKANPTVYSDSTGQYLILPAVVDGEATEIMIRGNLVKDWNWRNSGTAASGETLLGADAGLYTIKNVVRNDNNIITGCDVEDPTTAFNATRGQQIGTVAAAGDVLGWNNGAAFVAYNDKTNAFRVDKNYTKIEKIEVSGIPTDEDDLIYAADDGASAGNKKLTTVIVVDQDPAATYTLEWTAPTANVTDFAVKVGGDAISSGAALKAGTTVTVEADVATNYTLKFTVGGTEKTITGDSSTTFSMPAANTTLTFTVEDTSIGSLDDVFILTDADPSKDGSDGTTNVKTINVFYKDGTSAPAGDALVKAVADELGIVDGDTSTGSVTFASGAYTFTVKGSYGMTTYYKLDTSSGVIQAYKGKIDGNDVYIKKATTPALNALTTNAGDSSLGKVSANALKGTYILVNNTVAGDYVDTVTYATTATADAKAYVAPTSKVKANDFNLTSNFVEILGDNGATGGKKILASGKTGFKVPAAGAAWVGTGFSYASGAKYVLYDGTIPASDLTADVTLTKNAVKITYKLAETLTTGGWSIPGTASDVGIATLSASVSAQVNVVKTGHGLTNGQSSTTTCTPTGVTAADNTSAKVDNNTLTLKFTVSNAASIKSDIAITINTIVD